MHRKRSRNCVCQTETTHPGNIGSKGKRPRYVVEEIQRGKSWGFSCLSASIPPFLLLFLSAWIFPALFLPFIQLLLFSLPLSFSPLLSSSFLPLPAPPPLTSDCFFPFQMWPHPTYNFAFLCILYPAKFHKYSK